MKSHPPAIILLTAGPRCRGIFLAATVSVFALGCASKNPDRCYLTGTRYVAMRTIFEQTGSYQRVAQAMKDEGWAECEVRSKQLPLPVAEGFGFGIGGVSAVVEQRGARAGHVGF
jgi:hypothetical protein